MYAEYEEVGDDDDDDVNGVTMIPVVDGNIFFVAIQYNIMSIPIYINICIHKAFTIKSLSLYKNNNIKIRNVQKKEDKKLKCKKCRHP